MYTDIRCMATTRNAHYPESPMDAIRTAWKPHQNCMYDAMVNGYSVPWCPKSPLSRISTARITSRLLMFFIATLWNKLHSQIKINDIWKIPQHEFISARRRGSPLTHVILVGIPGTYQDTYIQYTYIYTYIHTYTHIYIYIHTHYIYTHIHTLYIPRYIHT